MKILEYYRSILHSRRARDASVSPPMRLAYLVSRVNAARRTG
jgi:hypothetical protein